MFRYLLTFLLLAVVSAGTNQDGLDFLAKMKTEEGVIETASGLLYKEVRAGTGPSPTMDTKCSCHYAGRLIDGSKFSVVALPSSWPCVADDSDYPESCCLAFRLPPVLVT